MSYRNFKEDKVRELAKKVFLYTRSRVKRKKLPTYFLPATCMELNLMEYRG